MNEETIGKIVPVVAFALEKKAFRADAMFTGTNADERGTFSINVLYENTFDPSDNTHRFALMPDNPMFKKIKDACDQAQIEIEDYPIKNLSESLKDMYGAWVIVDMSKTPVCRVYTENVSRIVGGKVEVVHRAGEPIRKTDPKTRQETEELAIMTQVPVWGFCRKTPLGNWVWLKDNDPIMRIQREINQGRMIYVDLEKDFSIKDGPNAEKSAEDATGEQKPLVLENAPDLGAVG